MATDPRRTGRWKRVRLDVLARDGYVCMIRGPRCTRVATAVDHVIPLAHGGEPFDPLNLRAACAACNSGRRAPRRPFFAVPPEEPRYPGPSRDW